MTRFDDALYPVYASLLRAGQPHGPDAHTRHPAATRRLIDALGLPLGGLPAITISGSKGKGSTALLCAALLEQHGQRVGLITSPHLDHFLERIRYNGLRMDEAQFIAISAEIAPILERIDSQLPPGQYIGPNGVVLACALRWFQHQPVDVLVLEVGRGGRFDELGLYENAVTALTPIMAEHLAQLGPTLRDVAWHKAGLIRTDQQVVSAPQPPEVLEELLTQARHQQATLRIIQPDEWQRVATSSGQQVYLHRNAALPPIQPRLHTAGAIHPPCSAVTPPRGRSRHAAGAHMVQLPRTAGAPLMLELGSAAPYQAANAALAVAAVEALVGTLPSPIDLRGLRLAGRCEQLDIQPVVIVDGAINAQAAHEFLAGALPISPEPRTLVLSLGADKDAAGLLDALAPHVGQIIVTEARNPNLRFGPGTLEQARAAHPAVTFIRDPLAAFAEAQSRTPTGGSLWLVGTQSLVRDALQHWQRDLRSIWAAGDPSAAP